MAVTLGKDCTITGIGNNTQVRSVSVSMSAKEVESHPFGQRGVYSRCIGHTTTVDIEFVDDPSVWSTLANGSLVTISASGASGSFVVTNITRNEPLDDVVTVNVTAKSSHSSY
jgi:hypothetical protein